MHESVAFARPNNAFAGTLTGPELPVSIRVSLTLIHASSAAARNGI